MKYKNTNACTARHTNNICYLFLEKCLYPNQTFLRLAISLFPLRGFDNALKRAFLDVLFFTAMRITRNYAEAVPFRKISTPRNEMKLRYFTQCSKQLGLGSSPQSCFYSQYFQAQSCLTVSQYFVKLLSVNKQNFNCIPVIFKWSSLIYCIPLVQDQSSFYEIRSLIICINIKAFNRVNKKQLNILKTSLEYLRNYILFTKDDSVLKTS